MNTDKVYLVMRDEVGLNQPGIVDRVCATYAVAVRRVRESAEDYAARRQRRSGGAVSAKRSVSGEGIWLVREDRSGAVRRYWIADRSVDHGCVIDRLARLAT